MKLMKMMAILGVGLYIGLQTERGTELGAMVSAKFDAFVEHWSQFKAPALPTGIRSLVVPSATK